jgi:hypothetical protein
LWKRGSNYYVRKIDSFSVDIIFCQKTTHACGPTHPLEQTRRLAGFSGSHQPVSHACGEQCLNMDDRKKSEYWLDRGEQNDASINHTHITASEDDGSSWKQPGCWTQQWLPGSGRQGCHGHGQGGRGRIGQSTVNGIRTIIGVRSQGT